MLSTSVAPLIKDGEEYSGLRLNASNSHLLLTLFVNQTPIMVRNVTLEGMFTIDEISIINVNPKTIIVTTDEDMADLPLSNKSDASLQNGQSYKESTNESYPDEKAKV